MARDGYKDGNRMYGLGCSGNVGEVLAWLDTVPVKRRPLLIARAMEGASQYGHTDLVRQLLDRGANVNDTDTSQTPLMRACGSDNQDSLETVRLLLTSGAGIEITNRWNWTALMYAASSGNVHKVALLLEYGANLYHREMNGLSVQEVARGVEVHHLLRQALASHETETGES